MIDLKEQFVVRYRVTLDESAKVDTDREAKLWCQRIPCVRGFISVHGPSTLAGFTDRPKIVAMLIAIPGVRVYQRGDSEARVLFDPEILETVAEVLKARRHRRVSDATRERLRSLGRIHSPFLHREALFTAPCHA
ncbi:MAG: hypothetical protein ACLQGP_36865 [Isosphaeraceae bacterium]